MKKSYRHGAIFFSVAILIIAVTILLPGQFKTVPRTDTQSWVKLPDPVFASKTSVEETLKQRRSIRQYSNEPLTLQDISQLLWAAQGITSDKGFRTAPSAGALYPLEIYLAAGNVEKLSPGIYHYSPAHNLLQKLQEGDVRMRLVNAAKGQASVQTAAADIIISAVFSRITRKYGELGNRFVLMEAGHCAQNIYLQAVSLNIGTVSIGVFEVKEVKKILNLNEEEPLYIMPVGKIQASQAVF